MIVKLIKIIFLANLNMHNKEPYRSINYMQIDLTQINLILQN